MKNNPFKTSEEFLYGQNGGAGRVIDVEAARQEAELPDFSADMGEDERQRKIEAVRNRRLNLARAAAQMVFSKDIDLMDEDSRAGLYRASTKALFGFEDTDGRVAFGKKAGDMKSNLERLRLFLKGDYTLIEDPEYTKWREMDEEGKFRYALENEPKATKVKSHLEGERGASPLEVMFYGMAANPMSTVPGMGRMFRPQEVNEAMDKQYADSARRLHYDTLNDEEKAAYRADVIGDYEKKLSRRQTLATYLQFASNLSDEAAWTLAKCFQNGNVDVKDIEAIGDEREREKVLTALSMMRGDKKSGRLLGFIPQDFEDGTDFGNRLQMNIYGIQQAFAGLVTDVWDLGKAGIDELKIYAKGLKDTEEAREMRRRTDLEAQIAAALRQKLPDADSFMGALSQGVAENVHWIVPYGAIGKGKAALKGVKALKGALALDEMGKAAKGVKAAMKGVAAAKSEAGLARQMAALELYTERLRELSATADAALKAMPEATQALAKTGVAAKARAMIAAGRTAAFSSFANDYIETADAEGISRAESVPSAVFVGVINQAIERLNVPGLDRTITPAELKSLALRSAVEAFRHERSAGLRKWVADSVAIRAREMGRTVVTEALTEEPLQQFTTQMALEVNKTIDELKKEGRADLANVFGELWGKIGADGFGKAWRLYFDTVQESLPAAVGFGVTGVAMQRGGQMWRNSQERKISGDMSYDEGIVDVLQRERAVRKMMAAHWMKDGGKMEEARNAVNEMISSARAVYSKRKAGDDTVRLVANAAGVDRKTAEVLRDCLEIEESMALYSPRFRAEVNLADAVMDIDEKKLKAVLPEYVEGSFLADKEKGLYSARLNLPNGEEKTLVYRVGDMSEWIDEQIGEGGLADDGELADSYEARRREMPEGAMKPWSELSEAERRDIALQATDGFLSGRAGVFEFSGADGQKVTVRADDVISLASGRIADVGYVGAQAAGKTLRHETFHALWRFAKGTLSKEDIEALYSHFPDLDPAAASDRKLDERMAVEFERYASGNFVPMKVRGALDRFAGWAMDKLGKLLDAVGVRRDGVTDPVTGKAYTLSDFYDKVLKGELGSGELGVEKRLIAKDASSGSPEPQPKDASSMNAPPGEVTEEELAAVREREEAETRKAATETEKPVLETEQPVSGTEKPVSGTSEGKIVYTAKNPADASVPNQRYYTIGLPNSDVKLVGRLEVRDAHAGLTTSTDEDYHDRGNQNRDDKSEESRALVMKIAGRPDPLQIGTVQPIANNGIVWALPNGDVIIGNHRVNGVRAGYEKGTAGELEKFVREDAAKRGIEIGEHVKAPLTVFILEKIDAPEGVKADVHEVVRLANESQNRGFNIREQAGNDAKILIDNNLLPRMAFRADGRIDETKSADAIGKFRQESGAQGMVGEDGMLTEEGQTRLQNAAVAALLSGTGNNALLGRIMDNAGRLDMASQLRALMKVTPELMALAKTKPEFDIRDALAEALTLYTEWREKDEEKRSEKGKSRHDWRKLDKEGKRKRGLSWEAFMSQGDKFRTPSAEAKILGDLFARTEQLRSFDRKDVESAAGKKRVVALITDYLTDYIENARNVNTETDAGGTPASRAEVLAAQRAKGLNGPRFSVTVPTAEELAQAQREYDEVVARYTNPDGTKKPGWMKAPNGVTTKLIEALGKEAGERAWVQINTPNFRANYFGFYNLPKHQFNIVTAESAPFNNTKDGVEWAKANGIVGLMTNKETNGKGEINISASSVSEMLNLAQMNKSISKDAHFAALTQIRNIIRESELADRHPHYAKGPDGKRSATNGILPDVTIDVLYGAMEFNGETYRVKTTLRRYRQADRRTRAYAYEVSEIEVLTGKPGSPESSGTSSTSISGSILLQGVRNHKGNLILEDFSKVVDENGEPLVVYRGSEYDPLAQEPGDGVIKPEAYFTADPEYAKRYTGNGGKVRAYYLNIRNPFDVRRPECLADLKRVYPDHAFAIGNSGALDWGEATVIDAEFLEDNFPGKYDGIIYDEGGDLVKEEVVYRGVSFVPINGGSQVKSATDNTGVFGGANADIRFSINPNLRADVEAALNTDPTKGAVVKGGKRVVFGRSQRLFPALGLQDGNIYSKAYALRKIAVDHKLTAEQIAAAPDLIEKPAAVFDDNGKGYVFLTDAIAPDRNGTNAPVMFYIRPDGEGNYIASAYSRTEDAEAKYVNLANAGKILYWDKSKIARLPLRGEALSSLITFSAGDSVITPERVTAHIVPQNGGEAQARFSVGGVYTGSAADYEKPSLHYVGKSNGVAFGWGLYGSSAKSDAVNFGDNIYEQAFFTNRPEGDESHLIEWDKPLSEENKNRILDGLVYQARKNEAVKNAVESTLADEARDFGLDQDEDYVPESVEGMPDDVLREAIERTIDVQTDNGRSVYTHLAALLTGKSIGEVNSFAGRLDAFKAASEFLRDECDIDGIKYPAEADGAKRGETHYVSFRDDNIRVDHKWTDGQQRFSISAELLEAMGEKAFKSQYGIGSAARNGEGFVDLERGDTFDGIEDYLKLRVKEEVENTILGISATIGSKGNANELARHTASGEDLESHKFAAKNALMLFKKSKTGMVHHDKKGTGKDYIRVFAPFYFNGEIYLATITLRRDKDSDKIYSIESVLTKKDAVSGVPRGKTAPFQNAASQESGDSPRSSRRTAQEAQSPESLKTGDSPRSSRRTAQEAQSPVSLEDKISYYLGNVNETEPKFVNSGEKFSQEELLRRIRADISALRNTQFQPARRASMSFAYPNLAWMSNEELLSAAVAAKMALGKSDKVSDRYTTINEVQRKVQAIHPDWDSTKVSVEAQRILGDARKLSKEIRGDIDKGVSDSLILEHLPQSMRTVFGEEMTGEARRGWRLGLFQAKAEAGVKRKVAAAQDRLMRDALEIETGMMYGDIERGFGVDLAATLLKVKENEYLKVVPKSSGGEAGAASGEVETMGESVAEDAFSADETVEEVKPKVSALVQAIAKRAEAKAKEESKKRKANRERAENRVGNEDINDGKDAAPDTGDFAGGEISPEEVVEEAVKVGADLNNPLSFALFVMEMARENWVKKHNLNPDAEPKHSLVYIQFQRKTLQDVYSTLARRVTYSRGRETVMNAAQRLDKVTTMRGLIRKAEFMGKLVNAKMIRESALAMCERLDNLLKTEFQTGRQFKPDEESLNRKVPAMLERQARYMRHAMWLTPDGVSEEAEELRRKQALAGSEFDEHGADKSVSRVIDEADMKLKILADWGALKYKDLATVEAAVQWWLNAAEGGADAIAQAWDVREARTLKAAGVLAKAVRNPKRKTAVDGKSWTQTANEIFQGHFLFHHVLTDLTRFAGEEDRAAAMRYIDWLDLEIQKAGTRVASERIKMQDEMRKAVEQIYGRKFRDVVSELSALDGRFDAFMGEADDGVSVPGTKGRAMQLLVSLQQVGYAVEVEDEENPGQMKTVYMGGYYDNIEANGRVGQAEELLKLMTPADLNFIKWLRQWYERNRKGISEVSERIFGVGVMAELGNYMPVKMLLDPKGLENGAGATWQIFPKALTPRVRNKRDFDTSVDILTMWSGRLEESIQWKHHVELGIELRGIFGRSELQKAIRANHGAKALSLVKGFITDILNGKGEKQEMMVNPMIDRARQFAALGGLGGNVGVMLKQTTSIPAFGFEIGVWRTFRHLIGTLTPQGFADVKKVAKSEEFRNRWKDGYSEEVQHALSSENPRLLMRLWMASMITNKAGDCVPALLIGHGIYRDGIEQGLSERDAMARTWMIVERTQQSSRIENRTAFQRRNALGNAIYQFLSTQNQMLNYEVRALRDAVADPKNPKKWGKFVRDATLVHFVLSTFYYWMGELYKKMLGQEPSEDQLKDWVVSIIVGPVGALYGVGTTTVDAVESWVKGYSYGSSNAVPALNWLGQVVVRDPTILIHDIFNGKKSWDDVCDDMLRWLSDFNATFRDARKFYRFRIKEEKQKKRK